MTITKSAWNRLSEIQALLSETEVLRLYRRNGRMKCRRGVRRDVDQVIEMPGRPTLLVGPKLAQRLEGRTLDVGTTPSGERLRLRAEKKENADS